MKKVLKPQGLGTYFYMRFLCLIIYMHIFLQEDTFVRFVFLENDEKCKRITCPND